MQRITFAFAAVVAFGAVGCAQLGMHGDADEAASFVPAAASSNSFEIRSSRLALDRTQSPPVRRFATQMIEDHTEAGRQMAAAASAAGITPPAEPLMPRHREMLDELRASSDAAFDGRYIEMQTAAHEEAITLFSAYADGGDVPALQSFARATLPTLRQHYEHVQRLEARR